MIKKLSIINDEIFIFSQYFPSLYYSCTSISIYMVYIDIYEFHFLMLFLYNKYLFIPDNILVKHEPKNIWKNIGKNNRSRILFHYG